MLSVVPAFPWLLFPDKHLAQKHHVGFPHQPDAVALKADLPRSSLRQCSNWWQFLCYMSVFPKAFVLVKNGALWRGKEINQETS